MKKYFGRLIFPFLIITAFFTTIVNAQPDMIGKTVPHLATFSDPHNYAHAWTKCPTPYTASWVFASCSLINSATPCGVQNAIAQKGKKYGPVRLPSAYVSTVNVYGTKISGQSKHVATDQTSMSSNTEYFDET